MKRWARKYNKCKNCKTTKLAHKGHGLCLDCYDKGEYGKINQNKYKKSEKGRAKSREYERYLRLRAIEQYSNGTMKCKECGYDDLRALAIDHIENDGWEFRKSHRVTINAWLRTNKYPTGFQVLCHNCNWIKEIERRKS